MARTKPLEALSPVPGAPGLLTARKGAARMCAAALGAGGWLVYSPIDADPDAIAACADGREVRAFLAPSHFHHLGLQAWSDAFPDAAIHAPAAAIPRLEARTGLAIAPLADLPALAPGLSVLEAPGVKAGEAWLRAEGDGVTWAVCDAFATPAAPDDPPAQTTRPRGAFATMCVGDPAVYKAWALARIAADQPTQLLPAHGGAVAGPDVAARLAELVEAL
ncbi:hypothetical protein ACK8OR_07475 [Jannaschia sp. KMU-145]|uniref:hypothetical protein n=1 Tax=Jannaschia halovivens TaxID=3388667 RepID=UPI00396B1D90